MKNTGLVSELITMQTAGGATLIFDTELIAVNEKPAGGEQEQEEEDVDDTYGADEL